MTYGQGFPIRAGRAHQCSAGFDRAGGGTSRGGRAVICTFWDIQASSLSLRSTSSAVRAESVDSGAEDSLYGEAFRHADSEVASLCQVEWEEFERGGHTGSGNISLEEVSRGAKQQSIEKDPIGIQFRSSLGQEVERSLSASGAGQELGGWQDWASRASQKQDRAR